MSDPFPSKKIHSKSAEETVRFGKQLGQMARPGDIFCLSGDLGSGKTTLVKGIAQGLKISSEKVHSPTFVLLSIYEGKSSLFHFDLYRLEDIKEILAIGYEEYFYGEGISVVEWAERLGKLQPKEYISLELKHGKENERFLTLSGQGERARELVTKIKAAA